MMSWAWKYHASKSGLHDTQYEWWKRWSVEYRSGTRTHEPLIEELARTLVIAENFRSLSEKEHETFPGTLGALWGVVLTAQRTGSLVQTRLSRLFVHKEHRGWKVANWTREEMKGGRDGGRSHSLPIPSAALGILLRYHDLADRKSDWLFPSGKANGHVTKSALNQILYRLQGKRYDLKSRAKPSRKGKPGPKPLQTKPKRQDLFRQYEIRPWNPHDVRRTLTSFLDNLELGGAASAILAHKIPTQNVPERELMAPVTQQHYNSSQKISLKKRGMELWVRAVLTAYKQEKAKLAKNSLKSSDLSPQRTRKQLISQPLTAA
jgi:integrase